MKTEAAHILDTGATPAQLAAELGINPTTAAAIAHQYRAPVNTVSRAFLESLPPHLQRITLASNPTITE